MLEATYDTGFAARVQSRYYSSLRLDAVQDSFEKMNEHQMRAASLICGDASILGIPGSGKTRTLVNLLCRLCADGLTDGSNILAMTFTRNAASEMNMRLRDLLGSTAQNMRVGTIHSVARQVMVDLWRGPGGFNLELDDRGRMSLEIKKLMSDWRKRRKMPRGVDRQEIEKFIDLAKAYGIGTTDGNLCGMNQFVDGPLGDFAYERAGLCGMSGKALCEFYYELDKRRANAGVFSFDDMLMWSWQLMVTTPASLLEKWRTRWWWVIVDEVQDSSLVQWDISRILSGRPSILLTADRVSTASNWDQGSYIEAPQNVVDELAEPRQYPGGLWVLGDSSQSIYRWRGAAPDVFVSFCAETRKHGGELVLPINYRSTDIICQVATGLVRGKPWHLAGDMIAGGPLAATPYSEAPLVIETFDTPEEESAAALEWAKAHASTMSDGMSEVAILARAGLALDLVEIACVRQKIPYRKMSGRSFLEGNEVKDMLAYLHVATGTDPYGKFARRAVNSPFRRIGAGWLNSCESLARARGVNLYDVMHQEQHQLGGPPRRAFIQFCDLIADCNQMAYRGEVLTQDPSLRSPNDYAGPAAIISEILNQSGYIEELRAEEGLGEDDGRIAAIAELQRIASGFLSTTAFLDFIQAMKEDLERARSSGLKRRQTPRDGDPPPKNVLTLSTIHSAKGLEWSAVRIVDVVPGRCPHQKNPDRDEELRLFYVGITRAKKYCAASGSIGHVEDLSDLHGTPTESEFLHTIAILAKGHNK